MDLNLLIVDDNEFIVQALTDYFNLVKPEWKIIVAPSCSKAREIFREALPDAALLDVYLGDGNGFELMKEMRAMDPRLPVIMMSGSEPERIMDLAPNTRDYRLIGKPFHLSELMETIEREFNASCYVPGNGAAAGSKVYDEKYVADSAHPMIKSLLRMVDSDPRSF